MLPTRRTQRRRATSKVAGTFFSSPGGGEPQPTHSKSRVPQGGGGKGPDRFWFGAGEGFLKINQSRGGGRIMEGYPCIARPPPIHKIGYKKVSNPHAANLETTEAEGGVAKRNEQIAKYAKESGFPLNPLVDIFLKMP